MSGLSASGKMQRSLGLSKVYLHLKRGKLMSYRSSGAVYAVLSKVASEAGRPTVLDRRACITPIEQLHVSLAFLLWNSQSLQM